MKIFNKFTVKRIGKTIFILSEEKIKKGDTVLAISGYPHWLDFPQECTLIFKDNSTIGVRNCLRVNKSCFRKIRMMLQLF